MKQNLSEVKIILLQNTISDCILINHLGMLTDISNFQSFANIFYSLGLDFRTVDEEIIEQVFEVILILRLDKGKEDDLPTQLDFMAKAIAPKIIEIINQK